MNTPPPRRRRPQPQEGVAESQRKTKIPIGSVIFTDTNSNLTAIASNLLEQMISEVEENIATTQAEYLANAQVRADEGFDSLTQAATHATDALQVFHTYGYYK